MFDHHTFSSAFALKEDASETQAESGPERDARLDSVNSEQPSSRLNIIPSRPLSGCPRSAHGASLILQWYRLENCCGDIAVKMLLSLPCARSFLRDIRSAAAAPLHYMAYTLASRPASHVFWDRVRNHIAHQ